MEVYTPMHTTNMNNNINNDMDSNNMNMNNMNISNNNNMNSTSNTSNMNISNSNIHTTSNMNISNTGNSSSVCDIDSDLQSLIDSTHFLSYNTEISTAISTAISMHENGTHPTAIQDVCWPYITHPFYTRTATLSACLINYYVRTRDIDVLRLMLMMGIGRHDHQLYVHLAEYYTGDAVHVLRRGMRYCVAGRDVLAGMRMLCGTGGVSTKWYKVRSVRVFGVLWTRVEENYVVFDDVSNYGLIERKAFLYTNCHLYK